MSKLIANRFDALGSPAESPASSPVAAVAAAKKGKKGKKIAAKAAPAPAEVMPSENALPALPAGTPTSFKAKPAFMPLASPPPAPPAMMSPLRPAGLAVKSNGANTPLRAASFKAALEESTATTSTAAPATATKPPVSATPSKAFMGAGMMAGGLLGAISAQSATKPKITSKKNATGGLTSLAANLSKKAKNASSSSSLASSTNTSISSSIEEALLPMSPEPKRVGGGFSNASLELKDQAEAAIAAQERLKKRRDSVSSISSVTKGASASLSRRGSMASITSQGSFEPAEGFFTAASPRTSMGSAFEAPAASSAAGSNSASKPPRSAATPKMARSLLGPKTSFVVAAATASASPVVALPIEDVAVEQVAPKSLRLAAHSAIAAKLLSPGPKPAIVIASEIQAQYLQQSATEEATKASNSEAYKATLKLSSAAFYGMAEESVRMMEVNAIVAASVATDKQIKQKLEAEAAAKPIAVEEKEEQETAVDAAATEAVMSMADAVAEKFRQAAEVAIGSPIAKFVPAAVATTARPAPLELPVSVPTSPNVQAVIAIAGFKAVTASAPVAAAVPELPADIEVETEEVKAAEEEAWESPVEAPIEAPVVVEAPVEAIVEPVAVSAPVEVETVTETVFTAEVPTEAEAVIITTETVVEATVEEEEAIVAPTPAAVFSVESVISGTEGKGSLFSHYTTYKLSTSITNGKGAVMCERRYREFLSLYETISSPFSGFDLTLLQGYAFPAKVTVAPWRAAVVQERVVAFGRLLGLVAKGYSNIIAEGVECEAKDAITAFFGL